MNFRVSERKDAALEAPSPAKDSDPRGAGPSETTELQYCDSYGGRNTGVSPRDCNMLAQLEAQARDIQDLLRSVLVS